ncbi:MAG TPA: hypothetical protein VHL34_09685 [Rhizomicrobium sp.]|jgi:hypothetical protein|nr:hypothetical protein [Rhizomicrobium sp.]
MTNNRVIFIIVAIALVYVAVMNYGHAFLSSVGAGASWHRMVGYAPLLALPLMLGGLLYLFALRYGSRDGRAVQRAIARREGRTLGFYLGSVAVLLTLYAITLIATTYFLYDSPYLSLVRGGVMIALGLAYLQWYRRYARRSIERHEAERESATDT